MSDLTRRAMLAAPAFAGAAVALTTARGARAQGTDAPDASIPVFRYRVGDIEVFPVYDGLRSFPLQDGFVTNASLADVQAAFEADMRAADAIENPFTATLLRVGGRNLLVDTGNGPQEGESPVGRLVAGLAAIGVAPSDIDAVVISHFHGDHISGLRGADGTPIFPNAETLVPEGEAAYWLDEGEMSRAPEGRRGGFERPPAALERAGGAPSGTREMFFIVETGRAQFWACEAQFLPAERRERTGFLRWLRVDATRRS